MAIEGKLTKSETIYDVELKITMREIDKGNNVNIFGFHSGENLRKTIEGVVSNTFDTMDEMFGNQYPSPHRDPEVKCRIEPLSDLEVDLLLIRSDIEEELLGEVAYVDGDVKNG